MNIAALRQKVEAVRFDRSWLQRLTETQNRLKVGVAALAVLLVGAGALVFWPSKPSPAAADPGAAGGPPAATVSFIPVSVVKLAPKISLPGTVIARNDSKLASEVEGRVSWVADVGTSVAEGDVVARLDNHVLGMQLASQRANVSRLAASLRFNRDQAVRMQKLYTANAIAKSQRDQATSTRDMTSAELSQAQAELSETQYRYDHSEIRAPFAGRVAARLINAGEYASPGKEIVRLVGIDSIEVKTQSPIDAAQYIREGMTVPVEIEGHNVNAVVRAIVPVGDELSRTVEVRLTLQAGTALVGDAAKVLIPSSSPRDVLAVPRDALVLREDATYIFKVSPKNEALRVAVETGSEDRGLVEIHGAVAAGDRIIVQGAERLEAGQKVAPKRA